MPTFGGTGPLAELPIDDDGVLNHIEALRESEKRRRIDRLSIRQTASQVGSQPRSVSRTASGSNDWRASASLTMSSEEENMSEEDNPSPTPQSQGKRLPLEAIKSMTRVLPGP